MNAKSHRSHTFQIGFVSDLVIDGTEKGQAVGEILIDLVSFLKVACGLTVEGESALLAEFVIIGL